MCYSAMIKEEYRKYVRATGAEMDLEQFTDIFWNVAQGEKLNIPRSVELWFDQPGNPAGEKIREYISRHRVARATAWQQDLFAQKKRLADAERKLATKVTKAAENDKRIATNKIDAYLKKLALLNDTKRHAGDGRIFQHHLAPIVVVENGRRLIKLASYHLDPDGKRGHYNARRDNLEYWWRGAFGKTHALLLVESFYEYVQRDGKNAVLHFVPRPPQDMFIACLYQTVKTPQGERYAFAAITDDPPPEVAATGHDRMIINLKPEHMDAWLTPQGRSDAELQAILGDRQVAYYEHQVLAA